MATDGRAAAGRSMVGLAVLLGLVGIFLWQKETRDTDRDNRVEELVAVISEERFYEEQEPDRSVSIGFFAVGGLVFLGGMILIAAAPPAPSRDDGAEGET